MDSPGTVIQTHNGGNGHREVQCSIHGWEVTDNGQCPKCNPPVPNELTGYLVTHEDWYYFANVCDTPEQAGKIYEGEDVAEWLAQFPDGSRVTITVEPPFHQS